MSTRARTILAWSGFVLVPLALSSLLVLGGDNLPSGISYLLPILAMAILVRAVRRHPLAAPTLMFINIVGFELGEPSHWDPGLHNGIRTIEILALDIAVGYIAATRRAWLSSGAALAVLVGEVAMAAGFNRPTAGYLGGNVADAAALNTLMIIVAWVVGTMIQQRRRGTETQRAEAEARAVQEERLRIAREVHDMVAHSIGVIAFQAGMGRRVIDTQPAEARDALAAIEDTSRETLSALRRVLGTLRRAEPDPAPLDPAPGLADLDGLVARSRDAGLRVDVRRVGDRHPLPPDIDLSAFRIIQEAVTNVARHAGTPHCEVLVDQRAGELSIEVTDDGRGGLGDAGYGISGMRERVGLFDGEFSAGPRPDGGFRVSARIPVPVGVR